MNIVLAEQVGCFSVVFYEEEALLVAKTTGALLHVSETARFLDEDSFLA